MVAIFLGCFHPPVGIKRFDLALFETLHLVKWYARDYVLRCLVPEFLYLGSAISVMATISRLLFAMLF